MKQIYPTQTLRHLKYRRLLGEFCSDLDLDSHAVVHLLNQICASEEGISTEDLDSDLVKVLINNHLVQYEKAVSDRNDLPFYFVNAVNFELTYRCNLACSHCLQTSLRSEELSGWINPEIVIQTLQEAHRLGLFSLGANFTGGEIFAEGSPLLELLAVTKELKIQTRANTNSWWAGQKNIQIGKQTYREDVDVVLALKDLNLTGLALSLDNRYYQYPELLNKVIRVAELCEYAGMPYQVVATEPDSEIVDKALELLTDSLGRLPVYLIYVPMEMVDIGHNPIQGPELLELDEFQDLIYAVDCAGRGFHRPHTLHIAPDGSLRSCMYAPGGGWLGNIHQQSLPEILNAAPHNPVYRIFKHDMIHSVIESYFDPWRLLYRKIDHSCTACALIARIVEEIDHTENALGRKLIQKDLREIHLRVREEYNLSSGMDLMLDPG